MTPEAQRIAIAEACGWNTTKEPFGGMMVYRDATGQMQATLPAYLSDLNACHEMEKVLLNEQRRNYVEQLIAGHPLHYDFRTSDDSRMAAYFIVNATASQRCEAFLRTLGLWKELSDE